MPRFVYAISGMLIGAALTTCVVPRRAIPDLDAAKLAPEVYQVRVDNEQVRVMEYHLNPGEKEPMHSHPAGVAVYFFTDATLRVTSPDGRVTANNVTAGTALWRDPVTHTAENIGTTEARAPLVELKKTCTAVAMRTRPTLDPVSLSPQLYKVLVENDKVRVLEYHLKIRREGAHAFAPCRNRVLLQ